MEQDFLDACSHGDEEIVRILYKRGVDINCTDGQGSGLYWALFNHHDDIVMFLLSRMELDVDILEQDGRRFTVLHRAVRENRRVIVRELLTRTDVRLNATSSSSLDGGETALHMAAYFDRREIVKELLTRCDLRLDVRNEDRETAKTLL